MSPAAPRFSLVSVVGDDAAVLHDFIASLEAQSFGLREVQVVLVAGDVPDDVASTLRTWADARPGTVTLLNAPEDDPVAALNAGLAAARGTWVGFPEVHDTLAPQYLTVVDEFLLRNTSTAMVATHRLIWDTETGEISGSHALEGLFEDDTLVDLTTSTWHFHDSAAAAFFPREPLQAAGLEFDVRLPAAFAGGHFLARYLIEVGQPSVAFLRGADYHLRRYGPGAPLGPERPFAGAKALFEDGYTDLVSRAREHLHEVPAWLQRLLTYELTDLLDRAEGASPDLLDADDDVDAFHRRIAGLVKAADLVDSIERAQFYVPRATRLALVHGYRPESWVDDHVFIDRFDETQGLVRARYYFTGVAPQEQVVNGGERSAPVHAKTRALIYLGRAPLCERILWVRPEPDLAITISGEPADLRFTRPPFAVTTVGPAALDWNFGALPGRVAAEVEQHYLPTPRTAEGRAAQDAIDSPAAVKAYAGAWVFTDQVHAGRDNAQFLFEHVVAHHPDINAWFVVAEGTPTWEALRKPYGKRLVAHGSHQWRLLMAHCTELLSSRADASVLEPEELVDFMRPQWRFTSLGHGVRTHDPAHELGTWTLDTIVTTTTAERDSIAGDGTAYALTSKEVRLTGMPRLDRLLGLDGQIPAEERDLLLVAPDSADSPELAERWLDLLADNALGDLCEQHDLTLTLLPHPDLDVVLDQLELPEYIAVVSYEEDDVQAVIARSRALITDHSAIAYDVAYVGRPIVYVHFDDAGVADERDGFGPVTHSTAAAVTALGAGLRSGPGPVAPFDARIAATFPFTDAGSCERVIAAVRRAADAPPEVRAGGPWQ